MSQRKSLTPCSGRRWFFFHSIRVNPGPGTCYNDIDYPYRCEIHFDNRCIFMRGDALLNCKGVYKIKCFWEHVVVKPAAHWCTCRIRLSLWWMESSGKRIFSVVQAIIARQHLINRCSAWLHIQKLPSQATSTPVCGRLYTVLWNITNRYCIIP